jgi:hypothetical protein
MSQTTPRHYVKTTILALVVAATGHADLTGSSAGQLVAKKIAQPVAVAAVLSQTGAAVTGTVAVGGDVGAGAYVVQGRATPKRVKITGAVNGVTLLWRAKISGDTLQGRARLKGAGIKAIGTLTLTKNPALADGSACDGVFTANQTLFETQVLGSALTACTACHVPGGQAEHTRFRVDLSDASATARSLAPFVDSANPDASTILEKPLALVPHGGGRQITPDSSADQTLRQWVGLIAAAGCS